MALPTDDSGLNRYVEDAIHTAVIAADRITLELCAGNPQVLALLTVGVAREFVKKLMIVLATDIPNIKDLCEFPVGLFPWHDPNSKDWT